VYFLFLKVGRAKASPEIRAVLLLSAALLLVSVGTAFQASAAETIVPVTPPFTESLPGELAHSVLYSNSVGVLSNSVSTGEYALTGPATLTITITDNQIYGDYYALYNSTSSSFSTATLVGTTPQVHTDGNLVAPTYNPLWDGTGSTYSTGTFTVRIGSGTTYFVAVDLLLTAIVSQLTAPCGNPTVTALLQTTGCNVPGILLKSPFQPSTFEISFQNATTGVPQFGGSPVLLVVAVLPLLYLLRSKRRLVAAA